MNIAQIESNVKKLNDSISKETFIFELLLAYGLPKASIVRLQKGNLNISKIENRIIWKKKLLYQMVSDQDVHVTIDILRHDSKLLIQNPRFIIVTDFKLLLAVDTKTEETLDINIDEIYKHFDFFLPWSGMEKANTHFENPADVKAAERMAKLYDELKKDNLTTAVDEVHCLNIFLSRLLFCFFAEDTGIFKEKLFMKSITSHTQIDGSDLNIYLSSLFKILNTEKRVNIPKYLDDFPYVNGGLFKEDYKIPYFTKKSRLAIINSGELNWSEINPDIFGSMIQAVVSPEHRGGLGVHYTSVPNIMKIIKPLFLDDFYDEFEKSKNSENKLRKLLERFSKIRIFDPACGSGNFLIIAYKEIRRLEMLVFKQLNKLAMQQSIYFSRISLSQFYGIEIDDFAREIAILSLWLAEHQMNVEFKKEFGTTIPTLPLHEPGNIVQGNATRIKWEDVCPKNIGYECFILGNPPYLGSKRQSKDQKKDMAFVFNDISGYKNLDYISCWFYLGSKYIMNSNSKLAFVTTNSLVQGEQVALLWPYILKNNVFINFAHTTFKWGNNAKASANVSCVIIGLSSRESNDRFLIKDGIKQNVKEISPYLTANTSIIIEKRTNPISNIPQMCYGNMPLEGGFLKLTKEEKENVERFDIRTSKFIRKVIGGDEFLSGYERFCLWINDDDLDEASKIEEIRKRIEQVRNFRINGGDVARTLVEKSHQFRYRKEAKENLMLIPCTSSERREYLQCGFFDSSYITLNSAQIIYDAEVYIFGILSSRLHMLWSKATAGCLESRLRYSTMLCYNTFPIPELTDLQKEYIKRNIFNVLSERERHSEKTIAQLYDPDAMPYELKEAHQKLDVVIERCYRSKPFESDEERLEYLFKLYEKMIKEEKEV